MKEETWVAVDGHGNEYCFDKEPRRDFPNLDLRCKWGQRWTIGTSWDKGIVRYGVKLPKGTIKFLTGKDLSYSDEPIKLEYQDYGNYIETRPEVLNANPDNWPES